jgi:hypothetical protein
LGLALHEDDGDADVQRDVLEKSRYARKGTTVNLAWRPGSEDDRWMLHPLARYLEIGTEEKKESTDSCRVGGPGAAIIVTHGIA